MIAGHIVLGGDVCPAIVAARRRTDRARGWLWRDGIKTIAVIAGVAAVDEMAHLAAHGVLSVLLH